MIDVAAMTKEQKYAAVAAAESVNELACMWQKWAAVGYTVGGALWGAVLARKAELGDELTDVEQAQLQSIQANVAAGSALPPITGRRAR